MNLGTPELLIVLAVVLLVFGARRVPDLARSLGQAQREFRNGARASKDDEPAVDR
jgi:sec-independent protein translocase protein TatA